jgi:uncharacterized protein YxeA
MWYNLSNILQEVKFNLKEECEMQTILIVGVVLLVLLILVSMFFIHKSKQRADEAYFSEQIRRNQERQKQTEEAERQRRMMQRERVSKN